MTEFNATIVLPFQHERSATGRSLEAYHITEVIYPLREQHKIQLTHSAVDRDKINVSQWQTEFVRSLLAARAVNPELCGIYTRSSLDVCYETFDEFVKGIKLLSLPNSTYLVELHPFSGDSEKRILLRMRVKSLIGFKWMDVTPLNTMKSVDEISSTMGYFKPYVLVPLMLSSEMEIPTRLRKIISTIDQTRISSRVPVWAGDCL